MRMAWEIEMRQKIFVSVFGLMTAMLSAGAAHGRQGVQVADPTTNPATWFGLEDYPSEALRLDQEGEVAFHLQVSQTGKPTKCSIIRSSGSQSLDERTCSVLMKRAAFKSWETDPSYSRDFKVFISRVTWAIPKRAPQGQGGQVLSAVQIEEKLERSPKLRALGKPAVSYDAKKKVYKFVYGEGQSARVLFVRANGTIIPSARKSTARNSTAEPVQAGNAAANQSISGYWCQSRQKRPPMRLDGGVTKPIDDPIAIRMSPTASFLRLSSMAQDAMLLGRSTQNVSAARQGTLRVRTNNTDLGYAMEPSIRWSFDETFSLGDNGQLLVKVTKQMHTHDSWGKPERSFPARQSERAYIRCSKQLFDAYAVEWMQYARQKSARDSVEVRQEAQAMASHRRKMNDLQRKINSGSYGFVVPGINGPATTTRRSTPAPAPTPQSNRRTASRTSSNQHNWSECNKRSFAQGRDGSFFTYTHPETGEERKTLCGNQ